VLVSDLVWSEALRWVAVVLIAGGLMWSYSGMRGRGCRYALVGVFLGMLIGWMLLWAAGLV
jgi:hypothetical protein